jgi:hypothetical protein
MIESLDMNEVLVPLCSSTSSSPSHPKMHHGLPISQRLSPIKLLYVLSCAITTTNSSHLYHRTSNLVDSRSEKGFYISFSSLCIRQNSAHGGVCEIPKSTKRTSCYITSIACSHSHLNQTNFSTSQQPPAE